MEKRDFSASALVQHAWEHDHHIDWTSTCVLGVESHYQSGISREAIYIRRQSSSLNRDRGTLSDMYDFIIEYGSTLYPLLGDCHEFVTSLPDGCHKFVTSKK